MRPPKDRTMLAGHRYSFRWDVLWERYGTLPAYTSPPALSAVKETPLSSPSRIPGYISVQTGSSAFELSVSSSFHAPPDPCGLALQYFTHLPKLSVLLGLLRDWDKPCSTPGMAIIIFQPCL